MTDELSLFLIGLHIKLTYRNIIQEVCRKLCKHYINVQIKNSLKNIRNKDNNSREILLFNKQYPRIHKLNCFIYIVSQIISICVGGG